MKHCPTNMFALTLSQKCCGNQSNQKHKEERQPHGYRAPFVFGDIDKVQKKCEKCSRLCKLGNYVKNNSILNIICHKIEKIVGSQSLKKVLKFYVNLLIFIFFLFRHFVHNLVKYCSIIRILDNIQQPTERAVENCPR